MEPVRFGANYIPSKNWVYSWMNWDAASVEEDLRAAREVGVDHIRAHLMWSFFQFDAKVVNPVALRRLEELRGICEKVGMDFCVTVFNGFISGLYFYPGFLTNRTPHSYGGPALYTDEYLIGAEEYYLRQIAAAVADSPNFLGFDLGNELTTTMGKGKDHVTDAEGMRKNDAWAERMYAICEEVAPHKLLANGVDHQPWIFNRDFTRPALANSGSITALHCYAKFLGIEERFGLNSEESVQVAPFMTELAKAFCDDPARPYWIQEFGTCSSEPWTDEMADFIERSIRAMYTSENLWGITWWCTNHISPEFTSFQPLEYKLGLLDSDNKPTPAGLLFQKLAKEARANPTAPVRRDCAFVPELDETSLDVSALREVAARNCHRYADYVRQGIYPALVTPQNAENAAYLRARGIRTILK